MFLTLLPILLLPILLFPIPLTRILVGPRNRFLGCKLSDADHPIVLANQQQNLRIKLNAAETG